MTKQTAAQSAAAERDAALKAAEKITAATVDRDATIRSADKELADAMHAVHVARANRDTAIAAAAAAYDEALAAATSTDQGTGDGPA